MILKGNARSSGSDLASHLLNLYDNDSVEIDELTQTQATDLHGAFAEFEAVATGTRCRKPLYSLSINPAEPLTRDQYRAVIDRIGDKLGLSDQPRAVVFHVKQGADGVAREHCHVVWSRIDVTGMKAVQLSHDRQKLRSVAQELAAEFEHPLPEGLARNRGAERYNGQARDVGVGELAQSGRSGLQADARRAAITEAYLNSARGKAFQAALEQRGYFLARGDKRGFVVVDRAGHVHSLPRQISGANTKDVRAKLAPLSPDDLPDVKTVRARIAKMADEEQLDDEELPRLRRSPDELKRRQAGRRGALNGRLQKLELKQRGERLALHKAQEQERKRPFARAARAVMALANRVPVLRSVLGPLARKPFARLEERHKEENEALDRRYGNEAKPLRGQQQALKRIEQRENRSLAFDRKRLERAQALQAETRRQTLTDEMRQAGQEMTARQREVKRRLEEAEKRRQQRHPRPRRPRGPGM
ncbi:relaxase/mobilization nuclease domain-containing protein [Methyloligella solikamskensis]|uniref:Relaxase/mobilization nuclease domain-containing protein n=1 Tax=Methyloligella solikamskensis TaxID=1177756 RepID=A0ABW3J8M8_9HYPH